VCRLRCLRWRLRGLVDVDLRLSRIRLPVGGVLGGREGLELRLEVVKLS